MSKYILAIDQGTTGSTVNIIDQAGKSRIKVNREYRQIYPRPGWVEHDPEDIWQSVLAALGRALQQSSIRGGEIAAIGITNQRETVMLWDRKDSKPVANAIVWQCRRTAELCQKLKKRGLEKTIRRKTGLVLDPYFSATKIQWLLSHIPQAMNRAKQGHLAMGTVDTFLLWRLTAGASHKTDVSNASRTMLMDIHKGQWDKDLLKIFSVPPSILPEIQPSSGLLGTTQGVPGLPDGIPISGIAGDQQAALFGQTCFKAGMAKCTFGTGSFILLNTGTRALSSKAGLLTTVAWQLKNHPLIYALEGGAFICGAAVQWLRDELKIIAKSSDVEALAGEVSDSGGVEFVPALTGLGAPYWDAQARGLICGLTRGSGRAHLARATLESMALQNVDILEAMAKDAKKKILGLRVDGGAAANNLLMQLQADYLGTMISRPEMIESTSAGAAYLAGLGVGFWRDLDEIQKVWKVEKEFSCQIKASQRTARMKRWHKAIERCLG